MVNLSDNLFCCVPAHVWTKWQNSEQRPLLEKQEKPVAVLFVDIEGCTRLCEDLPPKEMNALIETYFSRFFEVVEQAGGTVNEIMGDGFMAIFEENDFQKNILAAVAEIIKAGYALQSLGQQKLKNVSQPVFVFKIEQSTTTNI